MPTDIRPTAVARMVDPRRVRELRPVLTDEGPVIYAMVRDQRVEDNWALLHAQQAALTSAQPLIVACLPAADTPALTWRQGAFMLEGLKSVERQLAELQIGFAVMNESPTVALAHLSEATGASTIVTDFSPLRGAREWRDRLLDNVRVGVLEVDAHNIVPCLEASAKREYAAYTFRPKVNRLLPQFLVEFPALRKHPFVSEIAGRQVDWAALERSLVADREVRPVERIVPGAEAARNRLDSFLSSGLKSYEERRNDPGANAQSGLSPYLHFGQIAAQRVALEASKHDKHIPSQEAFIEELIVRRELSDNFCYYNDRYDSFEGFPDWSRKTLDEHRSDPREYLYNGEALEAAGTHDLLWNAAQREMVISGKLAGYMRMYWAKKILEWSPTPEEALANAIYLNDRYSLDGNDSNGYTGIAWSIGGVHDRPWFERDIFGKVRYMSQAGCQRKFDIERYIAGVDRISEELTK
jgi:deoxyribodipyrimidine photo-lyase